MEPKDFLGFIKRGLKDYSRDPWIFLRELAQNSRDAEASTINIQAEVKTGMEVLTFLDDGKGISFEEAKQFLFRLFASSKIGDQESAGLFGIGFWSVIRYKPSLIRIESQKKTGERWALEIDQDFNRKQKTSTLKTTGTKITLKRPLTFDNPEDFIHQVRVSAIYHCQYIRRKIRLIRELPTFFNDEKISRRIIKPSIPFEISFKKPTCEGYAGISEQPSVKIYAKGLLVWEGISISEFFTHQKPEFPQNIEGFSPTIVLNSNRLRVDISRKKIFEDQAFKKLLKNVQAELQNLIKFNSQNPSGLKIFKTSGNLIKNLFSLIRSHFILVFLVIIIGLSAGGFLGSLLFQKQSGESALSGFSEIKAYHATVSDNQTGPAPFSISCKESRNLNLSMFIADLYEPQKGFTRRGENPKVIPVLKKGKKVTIDISGLNIEPDIPSEFYLPHPSNFSPIISEFKINGKVTFPDLHVGKNGEVFLKLKFKDKISKLSYRCDEISNQNLSREEFEFYTRLPENLPGLNEVKQLQNKILELDNLEKVKILSDFTTAFLTYDRSASTILQFKKLQTRHWLEKIITIKKGDCDVINGFLAYLLRTAKIPARLAIGYHLQQTDVSSHTLHAWCEFFRQGHGWQGIDLTGDPNLKIIPSPELKTSNPLQNSINRNLYNQERMVVGNKSLIKDHLYFFFSILFLLLASLLFISKWMDIKKKKKYKKKYQTDKIIADLCITSLKNPRIWGYNSQFWNLAIIPAVNRKNLSLKELIRLSSKNRLISTEFTMFENPLLQLVKNEYAIVYSRDPYFEKLFKIVPTQTELDRLYHHILEYQSRFQKLYSKLFNGIETAISIAFKQQIKLYTINNEDSEELIFFHFRHLLKRNKTGLKFIILNQKSNVIRQKLLEYTGSLLPDHLIIYEIIKKIIDHPGSSVVFPSNKAHNQQILAKTILRQIYRETGNDS